MAPGARRRRVGRRGKRQRRAARERRPWMAGASQRRGHSCLVSELPMFPLGTVLLPGAVLPLHVFEPRYRALVEVCVAGDREFGVVLIERGNEVGGGDTRTSAGCVARIAEVRELPDGRYLLVA